MMTEKQNRNYRYSEIIREQQGKEYLLRVDIIKEEQCQYCQKRNKVNCRLNIRNNECINYIRKK